MYFNIQIEQTVKNYEIKHLLGNYTKERSRGIFSFQRQGEYTAISPILGVLNLTFRCSFQQTEERGIGIWEYHDG